MASTTIYKGEVNETEKLDEFVTNEIYKVIFITSMTSYLYHSDEELSATLNKLTGSSTAKDIPCLMNEYYIETRNALIEIFGVFFVKRLSGK